MCENGRKSNTDGRADRLLAIQAKYGRRVEIETLAEEALITISSLDSQLGEAEVITEFGLTDYSAFIDRCTAAQIRARSKERS